MVIFCYNQFIRGEIDMNSNDEVIEILDDINDSDNVLPNLGATPNNTAPTNVQNNEIKEEYIELEKQLEEVNYEPIAPENQEIKIETEEESDKSKSGLSFVIIIFILLGAFIIALPYISKLLS